MAKPSFIFDANEEDVDALVRENSTLGPYWAAYEGLTVVFNLLGGEHELVVKYRKQMMSLMF